MIHPIGLALTSRRLHHYHPRKTLQRIVLFPFVASSTQPRVVITGAGVVTALGFGWRANAEGFRAGKTAMRPITLFDVGRQRTKTGAQVDVPETVLADKILPHDQRRLDRAAKMLLLAAEEAWKQSGWSASENLPLVLGTTSGGMALGEAYYRQAIHAPKRDVGQAERVNGYQAQRQALDLAGRLRSSRMRALRARIRSGTRGI